MKQKILQRLVALLKLSGPYMGRLVIACLLMACGSLIALILPLLIGRFIDALTLDDPAMSIKEVAIAMMAIMVIQGMLSLVGGLIIAFADERVFAELRVRAFSHLHRLPLSFFSDRKQGELVSRVASDVEQVSAAGPGNIAAILQSLLTVAGSIVVMLFISPKLLMWGCIGVPVLIPIVFIFGRRAFGLSRLAQDQEAEICGHIADNVKNNALVKAFNATDAEEVRFKSIVKQAFKTAITYNLLTTLYRPATAIISFAATLVILLLGSQEYSRGHLLPGDIVSFLLLIGILMAGLSHLASCLITLLSAAGAASRLFDILEQPAEDADGPQLTDVSGTIQINSLSFAYSPGQPVIHDLNLSVTAGQTVALTGPSGTGKSTVLKLINAFYAPQTGTILFDATDSAGCTRDSIRQHIAYLEQEPHLIYGTVRDNLTFGMPTATDQTMKDAAKAAQAHDFIQTLPKGYDTLIGEDGVKLSTGQRHRICLARALIKPAPILLLDEPGTALDTETEQRLVESLRPALVGKTCILVAHKSALLQLADQTIHLDPPHENVTTTH